LIFWDIACIPVVNGDPPGKASTGCMNVLVGFMSKEPIKIGSGCTLY
jgi:hypothetical protein